MENKFQHFFAQNNKTMNFWIVHTMNVSYLDGTWWSPSDYWLFPRFCQILDVMRPRFVNLRMLCAFKSIY